MERAGKAARAATDTADATNLRRESTLLPAIFVCPFLEVRKQISRSSHSSCSRTRPEILDIRRKEIFREHESAHASIFPTQSRHTAEVRKMRTDDVGIDVSRDWMLRSSGPSAIPSGPGARIGLEHHEIRRLRPHSMCVGTFRTARRTSRHPNAPEWDRVPDSNEMPPVESSTERVRNANYSIMLPTPGGHGESNENRR